MGKQRKTLFGDERAIEGLPIRLVIALVVGVAALALMMGMLGGIGQFNKTELDVHAVEQGSTLDSPGDPTVPVSGGSVDLIVTDENGDAVNDVQLIVTDGTALLEGAIRASTGSGSNKATVDLSDADLKRGQNKGTLVVEAVPPANSNYVDDKANTEILVLEEN